MKRVETKVCTKCKKEKLPTEFSPNGTGRTLSGALIRRPDCKRCHSIFVAKSKKQPLDIIAFKTLLKLLHQCDAAFGDSPTMILVNKKTYESFSAQAIDNGIHINCNGDRDFDIQTKDCLSINVECRF